jgi:hypothetical protein
MSDDLPIGKPKTPAEAKENLLSILKTLQERRQLSLFERDYIRQALQLWSFGKSLEQAFGFKRLQRGRQGIAIDRQLAIAVAVLRHILRGKKLEGVGGAAELAGKSESLSQTQVRKYWAKHKRPALIVVRMERPADKYPWTPNEQGRLKDVGLDKLDPRLSAGLFK